MEQQKKAIRSLMKEELAAWLAETGEQRFRTQQVWDWLWRHGARSFEEMSNLSKALRAKLEAAFVLNPIQIDSAKESRDGTVKYGFRLHDGPLIEGVLIPTPKRLTACVSSQAGCSLSCSFCATGYMPLTRNLQAYEIWDQVWLLNQEALARHGKPLTNIVYMGMGEPLLNYKQVLQSIAQVTDPEGGLAMSPKRITVSSAGIAKMIRKLGDDAVRFEFALSLHAANDAKRSELMPINDTNTLEALREALAHFHDKTGTRATLEYVFLAGQNDSLADAKELAAFSRSVPTKINIIEYNPIALADFAFGGHDRLSPFVAELERAGCIVNVRRSRGQDVDGACGQLAIQEQEGVAVG